MNQVAVTQEKRGAQTEIQQQSFVWTDNLPIQKLLDVVASIIADEYIQIAKQNPDVFSPHPNPLPVGEREITGDQK